MGIAIELRDLVEEFKIKEQKKAVKDTADAIDYIIAQLKNFASTGQVIYRMHLPSLLSQFEYVDIYVIIETMNNEGINCYTHSVSEKLFGGEPEEVADDIVFDWSEQK